MPLRPCPDCGTPTNGHRCHGTHTHQRPTREARGYDHAHRQATAAAIAAEPWCHTPGGCPYPDAGTPTNPLTGGHPMPRSAFSTDDGFRQQPRIPQCHRCNSGKLERR